VQQASKRALRLLLQQAKEAVRCYELLLYFKAFVSGQQRSTGYSSRERGSSVGPASNLPSSCF